MKLTVALLLVSLALCCYSATAELCPKVSNFFNNVFTGSHESLMESITPFATREIMKTAVFELKRCVLNLSEDDTEVLTEFFLDFGEKC